MKDLNGKVAVVTGAGSGIGQQLAVQLAHKGATVAATDYKAELLEGTKKRMPAGGTHSYHTFSVAERPAFEQFVAEAIAQHKQVDVVINNAGIKTSAPAGIATPSKTHCALSGISPPESLVEPGFAGISCCRWRSNSSPR